MDGASNASLAPYRYQPLDTRKGEIRLLRLVRPEEQNDAPESLVSITIRHANLNDENLRFNALSYAWGAENPLHTILVLTETGSHTISIRQNLYDFLQTALATTDNWGQGWIWIDQICINQSDHDEKCLQVSQMVDLYPVAQITLVWPGPTAYKTTYDEPIECAQSLFNTEELNRIRREEKVSAPQGGSHDPSPSAIRLLSMTTSSILFRIDASSYWNRLWIIQEISLASQVRFILLDELWDLEDASFAVQQLYKNIRRLCRGIDQGRVLELESRAWLVWVRFAYWSAQRYIQQDEARRAKQNWDSVLKTAQSSECTEPLDYIYGLMGLVPEDLRIHPDYSIPPRDLLRAILQKQILKYCRHLKGRIWDELEAIIEYWRGIAVFERLEPVGLVPRPAERPEPFVYSVTEDQRIEQNITLILQDLMIPIPPELDAAREFGDGKSQIAEIQYQREGEDPQDIAAMVRAETPDWSPC